MGGWLDAALAARVEAGPPGRSEITTVAQVVEQPGDDGADVGIPTHEHLWIRLEVQVPDSIPVRGSHAGYSFGHTMPGDFSRFGFTCTRHPAALA